MPILDVELVCASEGEFRAVSAAAVANVAGDPAKDNADIFFKVPASSVIPLHWHTSAERMVLISESFTLPMTGTRPRCSSLAPMRTALPSCHIRRSARRLAPASCSSPSSHRWMQCRVKCNEEMIFAAQLSSAADAMKRRR